MNKKIIYNLLMMFLLSSAMASAQTSEQGFFQLQMKQYQAAKNLFTRLLEKNPSDTKALFGLGEYYYSQGMTDSADYYFKKGTTADDSDPYNYTGLGKIALDSGKLVQAGQYFTMAQKHGKKDAGVWVEIAKAWADPKVHDNAKALAILDEAQGKNPKWPGIYLERAKISYREKNYNDAASNFEKAIFYDSTTFEAYIGIAGIYADAQNQNLALQYLHTLLRKVPDCIVAYREIGNIDYAQGQFKEAGEAYQKYLSGAEYTQDEKERYAYSLFFQKDYEKAEAVIRELSHNDPENYIMLRLLSYISFEKGNYEQSLKTFNDFFSKIPTGKILETDYEYYGKTLIKLNQDSLAIEAFKSALSKDSAKTGLYEEIGTTCLKNKQYAEATHYYKISLKKKTQPLTSDYFQLARALYFEGSSLTDPADSLKQKELYLESDSLFGKVSSLSPGVYLGYFWRARVNSLLDPESTLGLAKPYYEKALEILSATPGRYQNEITEIYSYLGFYYYVQKDLDKSREYWEKIIEIDPDNTKALEALKGIKKK